MRIEHFMYFCITNCIGTQGEVCRQLKIILNPQWLVLLTVLGRWSRCCSYYTWLCGLYCGALHVLESCLALCPRVYFFAIVITSLAAEGAGLCVSLAFDWLYLTSLFCPFSLPLVSGIGCCL